MSTKKQRERAEALESLRGMGIKPGDTVHTILEHVSRSGMSREIRLVYLTTGTDGRPIDFHPNHSASKLLGVRQGKKDGLVVGGCGMDMGFHVVYELSHNLFPEGFGCIGEGCPSNDHSNGDRDYTPHGEGQWHDVYAVLDSSGHRRGEFLDEERARRWAEQENTRATPVYQDEAAPLTFWTVEKETRKGHWHNSGGYALRHRWL